MQINRADIIKFYELLSRYNKTASNIGIVGDKERFKQYTDLIINDLSNTNVKIFRNYDTGVVRIIDNDIEISYIQINTEKDLVDRYFRKYV